MINFNKDNVFDMWKNWVEEGFQDESFIYLGQGCSKVAYKFDEESTGRTWVLKVEKMVWGEFLDINEILEEEDYTVWTDNGECCKEFMWIGEEDGPYYNQVAKEIEVYKNFPSKFLAEINLEQSNSEEGYEIQEYCLSWGMSDVDEDHFKNSYLIAGTDRKLSNILGYLCINLEDKKLINEIIDFKEKLVSFGLKGIFEDIAERNMGIRKDGSACITDYGYNDWDW